ncbi:MAG: D-alanine--D-alanine ligase [Bacteroidetes bacterium]|nr:D-alanine--D-alanine ligase [Bacteroidota bacterium]
MNWFQRIAYRPFFIRLFHWEYWSFNTVYVPIYIVWIGLCIRARSFFFFSASNPSIKNGGFLNESKKEIAPLVPSELHPKTIFFSLPCNADFILEQLQKKGFSFPLIGKPDIGGRGRGVKALKDEEDLRAYVHSATMDFHIQEFVAFKNEVGIFYYRIPGQEMGRISGIVRKEFLKVTGDGVHSIYELVKKNKRAILQLPALKKIFGKALLDKPAVGEELVLLPYGNHARGAKFIDDSQLIDEALTQTIDGICKQVSGFYFGRLDIRFDNWADLKAGKNFSIIEVNGAGSEPTHIYDPRHSLFFAWKEIIRHWILLWRISRVNHKNGHAYLSFNKGVSMFREDKLISKKLEQMG